MEKALRRFQMLMSNLLLGSVCFCCQSNNEINNKENNVVIAESAMGG